jgi:purine nucleosidase
MTRSYQKTMSSSPIIIDTDPGIDDTLAILLALASPEIDLAGLTVTLGNCPVEQGTHNALNLLALAGASHIPVAAGAGLPLIRPPLTAPETHGDTGLGYATLPRSPARPVPEHAVDLLIRELLQAPGQVTLVAIAPLTNLAIAIRKEPRIVQAVRQVIIMGGALRADGNTTPLAEFNVYVDPHAASIVLHSGIPIILLPWDITREVLLTQTHVDHLRQIVSPISAFIADATRFYIEFHLEHFGFAGCSINDPAALALAFMPDLAHLQPVYVDVEIASETTMGKTVADFAGITGHLPNVQAVTAFDTPRFLDMFLERMEKLARNTR